MFQFKSMVEPFSYEQYRKEQIRKKIDEQTDNRLKIKVSPATFLPIPPPLYCIYHYTLSTIIPYLPLYRIYPRTPPSVSFAHSSSLPLSVSVSFLSFCLFLLICLSFVFVFLCFVVISVFCSFWSWLLCVGMANGRVNVSV